MSIHFQVPLAYAATITCYAQTVAAIKCYPSVIKIKETAIIRNCDTTTGAIIGVGSIRRLSAVRWGIAGRIVWAWILTIPASALIAAFVYWVTALMIAS